MEVQNDTDHADDTEYRRPNKRMQTILSFVVDRLDRILATRLDLVGKAGATLAVAFLNQL